MKTTTHPHRLAVAVAVATIVALAPACGDDDGGGSSDALSSTGPDSSPESGAGECPVDESAVEDLFDVSASRNPEVAPGVEPCSFGVDGQPGFGFNVTFLGDGVPPAGSYDAAVEQMGTEPASSEGTGLVPVDVGDEAVARASAGHAEVLARTGDDMLLVSALLPPDHPLVEADDDLLTTATELARLAL